MHTNTHDKKSENAQIHLMSGGGMDKKRKFLSEAARETRIVRGRMSFR